MIKIKAEINKTENRKKSVSLRVGFLRQTELTNFELD